MSALRHSDLEQRPEGEGAAAAPVPGGRSRGPIHVAGMARAGTSWVAEMLRAAGGFVHLNEPFNPKRPPGRSPGILNATVPVGYIYVAEHNADEFRPALRDTFRFRYRHLAELRQNRSWFDLAKMAKYSTAFTGHHRSANAIVHDGPGRSLGSEHRPNDASVAACDSRSW